MINLHQYEIESVPFFYEFGPNSFLLPGQSFTVVVIGNPAWDVGLVKWWGLNVYILSDNNDVISLRNPVGTPFACDFWGLGPRTLCPAVQLDHRPGAPWIAYSEPARCAGRAPTHPWGSCSHS